MYTKENHKLIETMPDPSQPAPTPFERPSARAASSLPVQRGNYGIPPRQSAALTPTAAAPRPLTPLQPSGSRSMDILPPQPAAAPARPITPPVVSPTVPPPTQPIAPVPAPAEIVAKQIAVTPPTAARPLYTNKPAPELSAPPAAKQQRHLVPKLRVALLIIGSLLILGGAGRWLTAGSTSGDLIAAGAVAANDGNSMTIQFTADDGRLHKFTTGSDTALIPGTGVEVAYRSGAADNSAKRVAPIRAAHSLGISLLVGGVSILAGAGVLTLVMYRNARPRTAASIAKPVTV